MKLAFARTLAVLTATATAVSLVGTPAASAATRLRGHQGISAKISKGPQQPSGDRLQFVDVTPTVHRGVKVMMVGKIHIRATDSTGFTNTAVGDWIVLYPGRYGVAATIAWRRFSWKIKHRTRTGSTGGLPFVAPGLCTVKTVSPDAMTVYHATCKAIGHPCGIGESGTAQAPTTPGPYTVGEVVRVPQVNYAPCSYKYVETYRVASPHGKTHRFTVKRKLSVAK